MKTEDMDTHKTKVRRIPLASEVREKDVWNADKLDLLKDAVLTESEKQSQARKLRNELLAINYRLEDYIADEHPEVEMRVLDFVKMYLKAFSLTQKELAQAFGMKDPNLYKYLTGERKLNADIVLKLSAFSHTKPEIWYYLQVKNELRALKNEQGKQEEYARYDYRKLISRR
jgi:antitoxin HigA-1